MCLSKIGYLLIVSIAFSCSSKEENKRNTASEGLYYQNSVVPKLKSSIVLPQSVSEDESSLSLKTSMEGDFSAYAFLNSDINSINANIVEIIYTLLEFDSNYELINEYCLNQDENWLNCQVPRGEVPLILKENVIKELYFRVGGKDRISSERRELLESNVDVERTFNELEVERSSTEVPFDMNVKIFISDSSFIALSWDQSYSAVKLKYKVNSDLSFRVAGDEGADNNSAFLEMDISEKGVTSYSNIQNGLFNMTSTYAFRENEELSNLGSNPFSVQGRIKRKSASGESTLVIDAVATDSGGYLESTVTNDNVDVSRITLSTPAESGKAYAIVDRSIDSKESVFKNLLGYFVSDGSAEVYDFVFFDAVQESGKLWEMIVDETNTFTGLVENQADINASIEREVTSEVFYTQESWDVEGFLTGWCLKFDLEGECDYEDGSIDTEFQEGSAKEEYSTKMTIEGLTEEEISGSMVYIAEAEADLTSLEIWSEDFFANRIAEVYFDDSKVSRLEASGLPNYDFFLFSYKESYKDLRLYRMVFDENGTSLVEFEGAKVTIE